MVFLQVCAGVVAVRTRSRTVDRVLPTAAKRHGDDPGRGCGVDGINQGGRRRDDGHDGHGHGRHDRPPVRGQQQEHVVEDQLLRGAVLLAARHTRRGRRHVRSAAAPPAPTSPTPPVPASPAGGRVPSPAPSRTAGGVGRADGRDGAGRRGRQWRGRPDTDEPADGRVRGPVDRAVRTAQAEAAAAAAHGQADQVHGTAGRDVPPVAVPRGRDQRPDAAGQSARATVRATARGHG